MKQTLTITRKELRGYFGSPMALIFIGAFLAATLFSFFWVDAFFSRGIADVRPLFRRMPTLMIFLVAALTMRQWSEEQRSGTLEILLTLPISTIQLVVGKFLAVLALVAIALALTLFLPITVSILGNMDWGPVFGGYIATLLLASAYAAIGLFISSRTDNQIVALIATVLLCGVLYIIGTPGVTDFVGNELGEVLRAIGAGSRFESIQRGVVDLRDLVYYLSVAGIFLTLNVLSLKAYSWSEGAYTLPKRRATTLTSVLLALNLVIVNVWVFPLRGLRVDMTQNHEYSLSSTTRALLNNLQEPLLIRGYFSEKTHPKLAPLVPLVQDTLKEYEAAGRGKVQLEIIDPARNPEKEAEANQVYGIRPTPFQISGRYEAAIINSYFDILIQYGDQSAVLSFRDLINVSGNRDGSFDVQIQNIEYDLTSNIKKIVYGFQNVDAVLAALSETVEMNIYITPQTLPEWLVDVPATIEKVAQEIADRSGGKFNYSMIDPTAPDSGTNPQELFDMYGIQPFAVSLFSNDVYYLHMVLQIGQQGQVIYPSGELSEGDVRSAIESTLKRSSSGFLQVVGVWSPPPVPTQDMFGNPQEPISSWNQVREVLQQEYEVREVDLSTGLVPPDVNVLVVIGPENMDDKMQYAVDQYLMRGGAVIVAAGNYAIAPDQMTGGLLVRPMLDTLQDMLAHYGLTVEPQLVLDPQNEPFPLPVMRQAGAFQVQEIQALDYPFFVDVRSDGMAANHPIMSNLQAVTLNWASPITVDEAKNAEREVTVLLTSSDQAWTQSDTNIQPDFELYPDLGFPTGSEPQTYPLAVSVQGVFESYYTDKPSPFEDSEQGLADAEAVATEDTGSQTVVGTIETSPETARLIVIGSMEFLDDIVFEISTSLSGDRYLNTLKMMQNAVAWSTEDMELLNIRARGTSARLLLEQEEKEQRFWEILNYVLALASLMAVGAVSSMYRRNEEPMEF